MPSGTRAATRRGWHALRRLVRPVAFVAASALAVGSLGPARAEEPASPGVVDVTVAGSDEDMDRLTDTLREPLESLGLRVRVAPAEPAAGAPSPAGSGSATEPSRARVWVDARQADIVDVLIQAGSIGESAEPIHRTIPRDASPAVVAERVAYSIRASLESLLATPRPTRSPSARPPSALALPAPAPSTPPARSPPPSGFGLDAAAIGSGRAVASSTLAFGGGVALDVAFWGRLPWHPSVWLAGTLDAPFETTTPEVGLRTTMTSLRAVPSVELPRLGPWRLAVGVGGGVDLFYVATGPTDASPITLRPATTYANPLVEAQVLARVRLLSRVGMLLAFSLDYDTGPHHYIEYDRFGVPSPVLAPWTVRPAVLLGVCVLLTGASGCAGAE